MSNPLLNKNVLETGSNLNKMQVELVKDQIREVAKQLIEEEGLSGSLNIISKQKGRRSISPLKITTTTRKSMDGHKAVGRRSHSKSPRR